MQSESERKKMAFLKAHIYVKPNGEGGYSRATKNMRDAELKQFDFAQNSKKYEKYMEAKKNNPRMSKEAIEKLKRNLPPPITEENRIRNRMKTMKKVSEGDYYKPTKCSDCGITYPNSSAYMKHKDNLEDRDGVHTSTYASWMK